MYALITNNQIQVGPRDWRYSFFYSFLVENELTIEELPRTAPSTPIITEEWSILPVIINQSVAPVAPFEQLAGPYLTIEVDKVSGHYAIASVELSAAKNALKDIVTAKRYNLEVGGVDYTFQDGQVVNLYTNRDDRTTYLDAFLILPENGTANFKFSGGIFRSLTKSDLGVVVQTVVGHVQAAFDWETSKHAEIDACEDMTSLRNVDITAPGETQNENGELGVQ